MIDLPVLDLTAAAMHAYMSPFHDTKGAYFDLVRSARKSIHIDIFGFHIPDLTDLLNERHDAGIVVDAIFDHSQAEGKAALAEIARARFPYLIGVSFRHGQLLHRKGTVIDEARVECGSWNYSESASDQLNDLLIIDDPRLAHWYLLAHDIMRAFILRHERIFQPHVTVAPSAALAEDVGRDAELDPAPDAKQVHRADVARPWLENAKVTMDAGKVGT